MYLPALPALTVELVRAGTIGAGLRVNTQRDHGGVLSVGAASGHTACAVGPATDADFDLRLS
jgi:hypothetical protein